MLSPTNIPTSNNSSVLLKLTINDSLYSKISSSFANNVMLLDVSLGPNVINDGMIEKSDSKMISLNSAAISVSLTYCS